MPPKGKNHSFYDYDPSIPAAVVVCVLFGLTLIWSVFMTIRKRSWVWSVQILAILMEVVGYAVRIVSANNPTSRDPYAVQFCVIILAPVLMAGVIYVVFGRIVFHVVPAEERTTRLLWIPPRWITPIFVAFDVIALLVQLFGAVSVSSTQATDDNAANKLKTGKDVALAGLGIQMGAFGLFTIVAARFHFTSQRFVAGLNWRLQKVDGGKAVFAQGSSRKINPNWRHLLYAINVSCILILIRSVFRIVEFAQGSDGSVMQQEFYMYVLDTLPIFLVACSFSLFFPGSYLPFMGFRLPKTPYSTEQIENGDNSATALQNV
ncbi:RTA1-domain-containing protein [Annulohypoxylon bovei var. microspora]|nr:RTA1-domain-containing protein [Annulohypoxylon bovei var. microspora]